MICHPQIDPQEMLEYKVKFRILKQKLNLILERYKAELNPIMNDSQSLEKLAGNYKYSESYSISIKLENGILYLSSSGGIPDSFIPMGNNRFARKEGESFVQFVCNDQGETTEPTTISGDHQFSYKRVAKVE